MAVRFSENPTLCRSANSLVTQTAAVSISNPQLCMQYLKYGRVSTREVELVLYHCLCRKAYHIFHACNNFFLKKQLRYFTVVILK